MARSKPIPGNMVHFVDETPGDYQEHRHLPALVQAVYETGAPGFAHLHVYEADPCDTRAVDARYSEGNEPGTWHWMEIALSFDLERKEKEDERGSAGHRGTEVEGNDLW